MLSKGLMKFASVMLLIGVLSSCAPCSGNFCDIYQKTEAKDDISYDNNQIYDELCCTFVERFLNKCY